MVLRAFWNIGSGLVHRLLHKPSAGKGLLGVTTPAVWRGRTGLLDCDVNLHLNNSSYLYSMELARWHFTAANGVLWKTLKNRRMMIVASQSIRYRHAIPPFHAYEIRTQVVYWDDDWIYLLHQFQDPTTGKQYAEGLVRAAMMQGRNRVSGATVLSEVCDGEAPPSPPMPDVIKGFLEWDDACTASMESSKKRALQELEKNPPAPTPERLWDRIRVEMRKSTNL